MKIKSLLLGSAAAMAVATTGASAADAIIAAEPEPVEYVRVCDAFGSGYFFIPGTETCLRFSGYVRFRVFAPSESSTLSFTPAVPAVDVIGPGGGVIGTIPGTPASRTITTSGGDSYFTRVRGRLTLDAKSDTELGELHGRLRLQAENRSPTGSADATFGMDQGYLQLGGLLAGYTESAWVYSTNGGLTGFGGKGIYDGAYGYQQLNMLQYQFNGANFFAAISLEDDGDGSSWTPNVVGRLGGVFGGVTIFGVAAYDQETGITDGVWQDLGGPVFGSGGSEWGAKLGLNADIGANGNLIVQGFYASGNTQYGATLGYVGQTWTPEWSVLAAFGWDFTPTLTGYINGQWFNDFYTATNSSSGIDAWSVSGGFQWSPVTDFSVTVEGRYISVDSATFSSVPGGVVYTGTPETDLWDFVVQLQRNF